MPHNDPKLGFELECGTDMRSLFGPTLGTPPAGAAPMNQAAGWTPYTLSASGRDEEEDEDVADPARPSLDARRAQLFQGQF